MIPEILKDPRILNLLFSAVVMVIGLVAYWFRPDIFRQHAFAERAFEFWVLKWMLFVMTWGLLTSGTDLRFALAALDLNTVVGFGLVVALWKGDSYDERHTIVNLVFLFGLLFSWNFLTRSLIGVVIAWLYPSMTASFVYIAAMAVVIVARYRSAGVLFAIASAAYLLLQLPTYQIVFLSQMQPDPELVKWLAFAKVVYGVLFYGAFLSPLQSFEALALPSLPLQGGRLRRFASWATTAIAGGILVEVTLWAGKHVWHLLTGHPN